MVQFVPSVRVFSLWKRNEISAFDVKNAICGTIIDSERAYYFVIVVDKEMYISSSKLFFVVVV